MLTSGTIAGDVRLGVNNLEVFSFSYSPFYLAGYRIIELNNLAAAEAHQVVMFRGRLDFVVVVGFLQAELFYQAQLL